MSVPRASRTAGPGVRRARVPRDVYQRVAAQVVPDATLELACTVFLLRPRTPAATRWLRRNLDGEQTWLGDQLVLESTYGVGLVEAMRGAGLLVEGRIR